jgi:hypothetical protein
MHLLPLPNARDQDDIDNEKDKNNRADCKSDVVIEIVYFCTVGIAPFFNMYEANCLKSCEDEVDTYNNQEEGEETSI